MAILTVRQSGGDYSSLSAALSAANASDTISIEGTWTVNDTTAATISDDNLTIQTDASSKHPGYYDTSTNHYRLRVTSGHALTLNGAFTVTIDGLAISQGGTGTSAECFRCVPGTSDSVTVKNTVFWCETRTNQQDCMYTGFNTSAGPITLEQCTLQGANRGGVNSENSGSTATINVNSCTIHNCGHQADAGGIIAWNNNITNPNVTINIHNSIIIGNDNDAAAADYQSVNSGADSETWNISYSIDGDNSIASRLDSGTGNLASRTETDNTSPGAGDWVIFEDITTEPFDLRIVGNAEDDAQDAHTTATAHSLTIPSADIVGTSRPQNTNYDIGAFEIVAAGGFTIVAAAGSLTFSGTAANIEYGRVFTAAAGNLTFSGTTAALTRGDVLAAEAGAITLSGTDATLTITRTIIAATGSLSIGGTVASLEYGRLLTAVTGALSVSGTDAALTIARTIAAASGTITLSGTDATLTYSGSTYTITAVAGTLTFNGTAATLTVTRTITAAAGTLTFSGAAALIERGFLLTAAAGSLALSGTDATLTYSGTDYTITAETGTFTISGTAVILTLARTITADAGAFSIGGTAVNIEYGRLLTAEAGGLSFAGTDAGLLVNFLLGAAAGGLTFGGAAASLDYSGAAPLQVYTTSLKANLTPAANVMVNVAPSADLKSNPTPTEEVYSG